MSSTETESNPGGPVQQGKAQRTAKGKSKCVPRTVCKTLVTAEHSSESFKTKFLEKLRHLRRSGRGCDFCGFKCFEVAETFLNGLVTWRLDFSNLGSETGDRELRWIFQVCRRNASVPEGAQPFRKRPASNDSTETSDSCEDDNDRPKPSSMNEPMTTQRVTVDDSATETSNPSRSSSEALDMAEIKQPRSKHPSQRAVLTKAKSYGFKQRRLSAKVPSVDLGKFIRKDLQTENAEGFVCLKASRFFLGVGDGRLSRVTCFDFRCRFIICHESYHMFDFDILESYHCHF